MAKRLSRVRERQAGDEEMVEGATMVVSDVADDV